MKVLIQRDYKDCGVSCLSFIIQHYKGYVSVEQLREDTGTNHLGCSAYDLVETLKKYHFHSVGKRIKIDELYSVPTPCIAHLHLPNGLFHFVVITNVNKKNVIVMDPSKGKEKYSINKFSSIWDGVVILAIPRNEIPVLSKSTNVFKTFFDLINMEKQLFKYLILFQIFVTFFSIFSSFYLKIGLNSIIWYNKDSFYMFCFSFFMFLLLKLIFSYLREKFKIYFNKNIETTLLYAFLNHLLKMPLRKLHTYQEGELITRIEEVREIKSLFSEIVLSFFLDSFLGLLSFFILFFIESSLFIILFVGMSIYFLIGMFTSNYFYKIVLENMESEVNWKNQIMDMVRIIPVMKHLNAYEYQREVSEESLCRRIELNMIHQKKIERVQFLKESFLELLFFILTTYGFYQILQNKLTLVDFITFQSLYLYFVNPMKAFVEMIPKYNYLKGIVIKISEFAETEEEDMESSVSLPLLGDLHIQNVSFAYPSKEKTLSNISFQVSSHEHVFLKGKSGVGKSTICKLLIKELISYQGEILIGNYNLKDISVSLIRHNVVYLSQKESIIFASIKDNILFGENTPDSKFYQVCKICQIEEIVNNHSLRYESLVDEFSLSGGEKQRIMLARTLIRHANIYIFDECLSEVEEKREKEIIQSLREYLKGKMILYISHRNHTKHFDKVIEIENRI